MATRKTTTGDARLSKSTASHVRGSRALEDLKRKDDEGTNLSASERTAMIRSEFQQEALPTPPEIPGFHLCWLSTTSSYDPIHKRMRLGYRPVSAEEIQGFASFRMNAGEFEGGIACNEMLLFKIPNETYDAIMQEFHHNMPLEEEQALKSRLVNESMKDSKGRKLGEIAEDSDGFDEMARAPKQGVFNS